MLHNRMSRRFFMSLLLGATFVSFSCKKDKDNDGLPNCLERRIEKGEGDFSDIQAIYRLKHDGEYYYYLQSGCCDRFNYVYDSGCDAICAPSGGFAGGGTQDCPDYITGDLSEYELIWEAPE